MKRSLIVFLLLLFVLSSVTAEASCMMKGKKDSSFEFAYLMKMMMALKNKEELKLSDKQVKEIKELKIQTKKEIIQRESEIELTGVDIESLLWEDKLNVEELNPLIDHKFGLKATKMKAVIGAYAQFQSILSEEQMKKLRELKPMMGMGMGSCPKR